MNWLRKTPEPRVENTAMDGAADTAVSTAGVNSVEDALAEAQIKDENGTILLTPEEIRAALDAGTLDEDSIDAQCLADENGLLSWLWKWLFGKKEDNTPARSTRLADRERQDLLL